MRPLASSVAARAAEPPAESAIQALRPVQIDVTALQMPMTLVRIVRGPPVQHAAVVEHHELAGLERKPQLEARIGEELAQPPARPVQPPRGSGIEQRQVVESRTVVHTAHAAAEVALHDRAVLDELLVR